MKWTGLEKKAMHHISSIERYNIDPTLGYYLAEKNCRQGSFRSRSLTVLSVFVIEFIPMFAEYEAYRKIESETGKITR
jgi:hypothetical protein